MTPAPGIPPNRPAPRLDRLIVGGVDHLTAGQGLRDRLFVEEAALADFYKRLGQAGLDHGVLLSTCDRIEVVALAEDPDRGAAAIRRTLAEGAGVPEEALAESFFVRTGAEALGHFFSIAASLESQILGEPEVLGQVKAAHRLAAAHADPGADLTTVFEAAYSVAKRVRNETAIGENAVSIAAAGCQVAREVLGRFEGARAIVVGAGELGVLVAEKLKDQGLADIWVADPLAPRGEALAARLGAHRLDMADLGHALDGMDVILTGLGGAVPVIGRDDVAAALKKRRFRPIFLLDAAVPSDVEASVGDLDEAYLFTVHDLERIALSGQEKRSHAAIDARLIIEDEVAAFTLAEGYRAAAPLVTALRESFERVRAQVLKENPGISAEEATRLLINRLLHRPSQALRRLAAGAGGTPPALDGELIARLFDLPEPGAGRPPENDERG